MKRLLRITLFASLCANPLAAQDSTEVIIESFEIVIVGRPASLDISGIPQGPSYVGDTLFLTYFALDDTGARTPALIELSSVPANAMEMQETSDSTTTVVMLSRGNHILRVEIRPIDSIVVGFLWGPGQSQPEGTFHINGAGVAEQLSIVYESGFLGDPDRIVHADSVQVCAFAIQDSRPVATNTQGCADALSIAMGIPPPSVLEVRLAAVEALGSSHIETACQPIWCEVVSQRRSG